MGGRPGDAQGDRPGGLSATNRARPATRIVEAGRRKEWTGAWSTPVWRGSTHLYADSADLARGRPNEDGHFYYGRRGSPTQWALAEALTELEPGAFGTCSTERRGGDRRRAACRCSRAATAC
jgi:cystathionine beta-lyase